MEFKELAPWIAIAITLILSILVPVFTQIANNRFQLKIRNMEINNLEKTRRIDAFESFFSSVGACLQKKTIENACEAGASIQRLYMYLPEEYWKNLDSLFVCLQERKFEDAYDNMVKISKWIAKNTK